jgi:hypothetical protein
MNASDIDIFEVNEAFAVPMRLMDHFNIDHS